MILAVGSAIPSLPFYPFAVALVRKSRNNECAI